MSTSTRTQPAAGRSYGGLTPEDRAAARRARFVEAGIELFGTQGFRGATVRSVCSAAGLTDRYFYESFDTLEALLRATYTALMQRTQSAFEPLRHIKWPDTSEGLEARFTAGFEIWFDLIRDPHYARIVLHEVLGVSAEVDALYEQGMSGFGDIATGPLACAFKGSPLSAQRRELVDRALVGSALMVARKWAADGYRTPRAHVVRTCVLVAVGTVRAMQREYRAD